MARRTAGRVFNRLFNSGLAGTEGRQGASGEESSSQQRIVGRSEESTELPDIVASILASWRKRDYFSVLQLPAPTVDELGEPVWPCTPLDISRAYRQISLAVHPDKNNDVGARQAFEVVNEVHRMLKDRGKLETILKEAAVDARLQKERHEAKASVDERIVLNASRNSERKRMRQRQGMEFQQEILRQVREKQLRGTRKRERVARSRGTRSQDSSDLSETKDGCDTVEDPETRNLDVSSSVKGKGNCRQLRRKKPKLIF